VLAISCFHPLLHFIAVSILIPINIFDILIKIVVIAFVMVFIVKIFLKVWACKNYLRSAYSTHLLLGLHFATAAY